MAIEQIIFGAGCFWGVEATFRQLKGVRDTRCGYSGGHVENPSYEIVCSGRSGHVEVVQISFDPAEITLDALLDHFWHCHDPTSLDQQGPDIGSQYRSVIFCDSPEQEQIAKDSLLRLQNSGKLKNPIVTMVLPAKPFFAAEEYHQRYHEKHGISHY